MARLGIVCPGVLLPTTCDDGPAGSQEGSGRYVCLYTTLSSSSLLSSLFQMASGVRADFVRIFSSRHESFVFSHDRLEILGVVQILVNGVFGLRP